jgi:hypothetical protein
MADSEAGVVVVVGRPPTSFTHGTPMARSKANHVQ